MPPSAPQRSLIRALAFLLLLAAAPATLAQDADAVAARLQNVSPEHPYLLFDRAEKQRIRTLTEAYAPFKQLHHHILDEAQQMLDASVIERKKKGKRLLGVSRRALRRVVYLAYAHRMTGQAAYRERAQKTMLAAADFKDWNPSHFLDVAEMTAALAIGYDWLHDDLKPGARQTIRQAIINKGLKPGLNGGWWVKTTNNWSQVCHGGLTLGALAVMDHAPEPARQTIVRAINHIHRPMDEYRPDGAYPEGPGYWRYGTTYNVIFINALRTALGTDFGVADHEPFMGTATYYRHAQGPTGQYFNYSDGGAHASLAPATFWFAAQRDKPALLWMERRKLRSMLDDGGGGRWLPMLLLWSPRLESIPQPQEQHFHSAGKTPIATYRTGWGREATYLGIKGGTPRTNHAHMDIGSFVMAAKGVRWAIDLGSQNYHSLESAGIELWNMDQDSERWTVFRLNNTSHNTLVVDGQKQRVAGTGRIVDFSAQGDRPYTLLNMDSVYDGQLAKARRRFTFFREGADRSGVLIQDAIEAPAEAVTVRWAFVTGATVAQSGSNGALLKQDGQTLGVHVLSPADVEVTTYDTSPKHEYDAANPGTRMVGFEIELKQNQSRHIAVWLRPGGRADNTPDLIAPDAW